MINAKVKDDRVGAKNTELDELTIRGNKLLIRGYEFSSSLIHQEHEGGSVPLPPPLVEDLLHYLVPLGPS